MNNKEVKKEKRMTVSISLSESEKKKLCEMADSYGLSLSAFLRLAAKKYYENDKSRIGK